MWVVGCAANYLRYKECVVWCVPCDVRRSAVCGVLVSCIAFHAPKLVLGTVVDEAILLRLNLTTDFGVDDAVSNLVAVAD